MTTALTYDFQDHDRGKRLDVVLAENSLAQSDTSERPYRHDAVLIGVIVEFPAYKIKGKDQAWL